MFAFFAWIGKAFAWVAKGLFACYKWGYALGNWAVGRFGLWGLIGVTGANTLVGWAHSRLLRSKSPVARVFGWLAAPPVAAYGAGVSVGMAVGALRRLFKPDPDLPFIVRMFQGAGVGAAMAPAHVLMPGAVPWLWKKVFGD